MVMDGSDNNKPVRTLAIKTHNRLWSFIYLLFFKGKNDWCQSECYLAIKSQKFLTLIYIIDNHKKNILISNCT